MHLLVVILTHGLWMMWHIWLGILLEAQLDLGTSCSCLRVVLGDAHLGDNVHFFESCLGDLSWWVDIIWLMRLMRQVVVIDLVHGWCTCLWYRFITGWGTGWCMVHIYWYRFTVVYLIVIVWQWFHHSTSTSGHLDGKRIGGCSHLSVVARELRGL